VVPAQHADLSAIGDFVRGAVPTSTPLASLRARRADAQLLTRYEAILDDPDRTMLLALDGEMSDAIVGMAVLSIDEVSAVAAVPGVSVTHLVVAKGHRRRGVGRALLVSAVRFAEAHGIEHVAVAVLNEDRETHRYLARLGFAPLVVRRVAPTAAVHRALGMVDSLAERRLAPTSQRRVRRTLGAARALRRGA
jgi:GNAT superfamily N-acetyltransferase